MELDDRVAERLARTQAGHDEARHLRIGDLEVGAWGVVEATVEQVHPTRTFQRKRGGEGMVGRVTLGDGTGGIDLVLWDDEIAAHREALQPGSRIRLRGPTVKSGWKGGLELGLGAARIEPVARPDDIALEGTLVELAPTEVVGDPPRFKAEAVLATDRGEVTVVCWDDSVKVVQVALGEHVRLQATPHPALDGFFIA